jgi:hypothetical protein
VSHPESYKMHVLFLTLAATLFLAQRRQEGARQLPLAIGFPVKNRAFAVFFQTSDVITDAQLGTDTIEVADTHLDAELFLQCCLHFSAWRLWSCAAESLQPGAQLLAIWLDAHVFHPAMRLLPVYVLLVTGDTLLID